ncbi:MAG: MATE family efflux transporter [Eubacteriales bacterium]|nr:MATE family efflux transporter [Eubacteriales bacterium]
MNQNESFYKKLFVLVLPLAFQNLMTALVSASDALMLGLLSQSSLSAVSLATQVQFVLNLFYLAVTIGATVLAAQYWGKGDAESVEKILAITLRVSIMISAVFFLLAVFVPGALMRIFTGERELVHLGIPYLRVAGWSYLFTGVSQVYLCIMKNSGRALRSTVYGSVAVVLNIILNAILIFGLFGFPKLGSVGAAAATLISRAVEFALVIAENRKKNVVRIRRKWLSRTDKGLKKDYYHYMLPVLANEILWGCGFTMFSVIMGHLGSDAVASNSIATVVKNIISCMCMGIGSGSGILVGNELGSGNLKMAREYGGRLCRIAIAAGMISGVVLLLCKPVIFSFAGSLSVNALEYLDVMLYICAYYLIGKSINSTVIAGIFCAGGDTKFGMLCDAVTMWVIIIPIGMVSAFVLKLPILWVYFLLNLDEFVKLPAVYRHYRKYNWVKDLTA